MYFILFIKKKEFLWKHNDFNAQNKQHATANQKKANLQVQLHTVPQHSV